LLHKLVNVNSDVFLSCEYSMHFSQAGMQVEFAGLAELLARVATEDRTVIMTSVNEIWTRPNSLLDIFLGGLRGGEDTAHLVDHVLIVTVDAGSFSGCKAVHPHCYLLEVKSMDMNRAKTFGTPEYVEMIWLKLSIQQRVLELGYNFLFTARRSTDVLPAALVNC
jgi:hypothetical protein